MHTLLDKFCLPILLKHAWLLPFLIPLHLSTYNQCLLRDWQETTLHGGHCCSALRVKVYNTFYVLSPLMYGRVDHIARLVGTQLRCSRVYNVSRQIYLHEIGSSDLRIMQAKGVNEKVFLLSRNSELKIGAKMTIA